tara:strand:+ start:1016 stop:1606 length:591 start_codon:yes stop_codon:yes gene_type:complete
MNQNPVIAILAMLIIIATTKITDHILIRNILGFSIIYMIISGLKIKTSPIKLLCLSLVIVLIFEIFGCTCNSANHIEQFESMDDLTNTLEEIQNKINENDKKKGVEKIKNDESIEDDINIDDIDSIDENSDNDYNKTDKKLSNKVVNPKNYTAQSAQQETFKLLNTVRELKTTIEELAPSLSTAKDVLGMYKQIKI